MSKIAAVGAIAVPLVLFFGYLYRRTSGKPMSQAMFQVYSVLQDTPGTLWCTFGAGLLVSQCANHGIHAVHNGGYGSSKLQSLHAIEFAILHLFVLVTCTFRRDQVRLRSGCHAC